MQARLAQEQQSLAEQRADETAHASSSAPSPDSSGKRVPWNKGRKHSASECCRHALFLWVYTASIGGTARLATHHTHFFPPPPFSSLTECC